MHSVAKILGRPVERLQELDREPLLLAFLEGQYETFVVRDLSLGESLEVTLDIESGQRVNPVELRNLDRQLGAIKGRKLEPELLEIVLRHPDIEQIQVRLQFAIESIRLPSLGLREVDWSHLELRKVFKSRLDSELRELDIDVASWLPTDSPYLEVTLSAHQGVKLGDSKLIRSIQLVAEPEVLDS